MEPRRFAALLAAVALAAFAGRAAYVLLSTQHHAAPLVPEEEPSPYEVDYSLRRGFDEYYYGLQAVGLAEGQGFKTPFFGPADQEDATHPPLTGVALAPVAKVTDGSDVAMRLAMTLAGAGVVVLVGLIGRHVAGQRAGLLAAVLAAVYPGLWMHDGLLMSETFSALFTALTVLCAYRLMRSPTWRSAAAAGAAAALATLTRGELALYVPFVVLPAVLIAARPWPVRLRLAGVALLSAVLLVLPWVAYNLTRFEEPVLISYGDGPTLDGANCETMYSGPWIGYWDGYCAVVRHPVEPSVDAAAQRREGLTYARHHLGRLPAVVAARVGRVWGVYRPFQMLDLYQGEGKPLWASVPGWGMSLVLAGLAVPGAVVLRRRRVPLTPLLAPLAIVTLVAAGFYGLLRNRVPAEIPLVVLASVALDGLLPRLRQGQDLGAVRGDRDGVLEVG
jgi:4-amino-4-deoxy-L-arabinose transferase-like glycosyltransferase